MAGNNFVEIDGVFYLIRSPNHLEKLTQIHTETVKNFIHLGHIQEISVSIDIILTLRGIVFDLGNAVDRAIVVADKQTKRVEKAEARVAELEKQNYILQRRLTAADYRIERLIMERRD